MPFSWWQPLMLILLYSCTFFYLASALRTQYGFPLDDSYIHQTVARNLARYGIPGFIPGQRSSGATSLIWTYLQAANHRFLHRDPVAYNLVFSWLMFACIGPLLFALARKDRLPAHLCWVLAAAPALCGNFMWLGLIGMEHLLFIAISLAAIYFWVESFQPGVPARGPAHRWATTLATGLSVGLLVITRPEAMVFGPLLLIASWSITPAAWRRPLTQSLTVTGIWAVFVGLILAANYYTSHAWMPATLKGRTWLYFHTSGGPRSVASILRFLGAWVQHLPRMFSPGFTTQMSSLSQVFGALAVSGFLLCALALLGLCSLALERTPRVGLLLLWAAVHFSIYLTTFPSAGHGGRYQPLALLLAFPCLTIGLLFLFDHAFRRPSHNTDRNRSTGLSWRTAVPASILLVAGIASLRAWKSITIDGIGHINNTHGRIALWLKQNVPSNAAIAAFDIGRISYDWGYGITDLGGLVDPGYYQYLVEGRVPAYLQTRHIEYLVLPGVGTESFGFQQGQLGLTRLAEYCSDHDPWLIGWRYTIHATQCQQLYRVTYPAASSN